MKYGIELGYVSKLTFNKTCEAINMFYENFLNYAKKEWLINYIPSIATTNNDEWLNDDFNNLIRPIDFDVPKSKFFGEIVQSNNKWRRKMLMKLGIENNFEGIATNHIFVRRDIEINNTIGICNNEYGFELFCNNKEQQNILDSLIKLYKIIVGIDKKISSEFNEISNNHFSESLTFVPYEKLKKMYPLLSFNEKINTFGREMGSFVLYNHVVPLMNKKGFNSFFSEDVFDFESYSTLYVYAKSIETTFEIGYGSFQVDLETLRKQNLMLKETWKAGTEYNHLIKTDSLPNSISLGIDINRILMCILEKRHVAEVYSSIWSQDFIIYCKKNNIDIF